jgi:predicted nucleic acid-binding Zn ribbon protein
MTTRRSYRCRECGNIYEVRQPLSEMSLALCPDDQVPMERYFGDMRGHMHVNFGFVESHYSSEEEARIGAFQFANL